MDDPVFVIHGVGNRDPEGFAATVASLQARSGVDLMPVYWGDLGAREEHVHLALPVPGPRRTAPAGTTLAETELRGEPAGAGPPGGEAQDEDAVLPLLAALLQDAPASHWDGGLRGPGPELPGPVEEGVRNRMADAAQDGLGRLRDSAVQHDLETVLNAVAEIWPATEWLSRTADEALLEETGRAVADAVLEELGSDAGPAAWDGLRGPVDDDGRLRAVVRRSVRQLDRVAGAAMKVVAGRVNHALRTRLGPGTTRFLGDVLVYQRHREEIQARVRERIDEVDPALGRSAGRPVRVVAHSLGGVIAVDMATAENPLWTSSLLTFGSQAAYFHLCDPRGGQLLPYGRDAAVTLPPSLVRWTNLWQPLDMLAFAASRVFRLACGAAPVDVPLPHPASAGLWTHSVYWDLPELSEAISAYVGRGAADGRSL